MYLHDVDLLTKREDNVTTSKMGLTTSFIVLLVLQNWMDLSMAVSISTDGQTNYDPHTPYTSDNTDIKHIKDLFNTSKHLHDLNKNPQPDQHPAEVSVRGDPFKDRAIDLHINTNGRTFTLPLRRLRNNVLHKDFRVLSVSTDPGGKTLFHENTDTGIWHEKARQLHFFHSLDSGTMVSFRIHSTPEGDTHHVEGIINDEVIIAPPTARKRHKRALEPFHHTIYKKAAEDVSFHADEMMVPDDVIKNLVYKHNATSRKPHKRFRRQFAQGGGTNVIEPEVLLFCDNAMVKQFDGDTEQLLEYLLHFWHAVNWKFLTISLQRRWPKIDLKIREIGVFRDPSAQPFIEENRIKTGSRLFSLYDAMDSLQRWLVKYETVLPLHDIAFLQTGNDACRMSSQTRRFKDSRFTSDEEEEEVDGCVAGTAGVAYVRGACLSAPYFRKLAYNFGIGEASTSFNGIIIATHEVGHLLGAYHDGEAEAQGCSSNSGFIMSYSREDSYKFSRFSDCSIRSFQNFLGMSRADCLKQRGSSEVMQYPTSFPGSYMDIGEQCRRFTGGPPCEIGPKQCEHLCCDDAKGQWRYTRSEPAVDGTTCGAGNICLNGQCVSLMSFG